MFSEKPKRRLEPSCIVFVPEKIEATTPIIPIAQSSSSLSITGELAGQRSVAFVTLCGEWWWQRRFKR